MSATTTSFASDPTATRLRVLLLTSSSGRAIVAERLEQAGANLVSATGPVEALRQLGEAPAGLCVVDLAGDQATLATIRTVRKQAPDLQMVGLIDPSQPLLAAEALQVGVGELLAWPFDEHEFAALAARLGDPTSGLPVGEVGAEPVFAYSPAMREAMRAVRAAAPSRGSVLFLGEAGAGRGVLARALHAMSGLPLTTFVEVRCAGEAVDVIERRLFGGLGDRQPPVGAKAPERLSAAGALCTARSGTLFLRGIIDAPARVQTRLAKLLRDGEAVLTESRAVIDLDVRLMAAEDGRVDAAVSEGRLRKDLADRLRHTVIDVPPLRRRRTDIPLLAVHLLQDLRLMLGAPPQRFCRSALALLGALPWPGNGTELRALVETLVRAFEGPVIELEQLLEHVELDGALPKLETAESLRSAKARFERDWISAVLVKHQGRVSEAARALGIQRTNLYRKVRQLNVDRTLLSSRA